MMSSVVICCIIYGVFLVFMGGIFCLYSKLRVHKAKRELEIEKSYLDVYKTAMDNVFLLNQLERDEEKAKKYPHIMEYLQQNRAIVKKPFTFDHLKFAKRDRKDVKVKTYFDEFSSCEDDEIRNAVKSTSEILERVYRQKHPVRAAFYNIKKNMMLRILMIVLSVCRFLIHFLESLDKFDSNDSRENALSAAASEAMGEMKCQSAIRLKIA